MINTLFVYVIIYAKPGLEPQQGDAINTMTQKAPFGFHDLTLSYWEVGCVMPAARLSLISPMPIILGRDHL